jgi:hypothetical protein
MTINDPPILFMMVWVFLFTTIGSKRWELAGFEKVGKGGGAFDGAWEAVFKRPIASKGAGK